MKIIENDKVVEINYVMKNANGEVLDSTDEGHPFALIQGKQNILPALEKAMLGLKVGDSFKITLLADEAYGVVEKDLIQTLSKKEFGKDASSLEVGMQFEVENKKNENIVATIVEIKGDEIVLDGNHPFAGLNLEFDIEIVSVRDATKAELEKGDLEEESSCGCC